MPDPRLYDNPSDVDNDAGEILVSGPDGIAVLLTPRAAAETGRRLIDNNADAKRKSDTNAPEGGSLLKRSAS